MLPAAVAMVMFLIMVRLGCRRVRSPRRGRMIPTVMAVVMHWIVVRLGCRQARRGRRMLPTVVVMRLQRGKQGQGLRGQGLGFRV